MKKLLTYLSILIIAAGCITQNEKIERTYFSDGTLETEVTMVNKIKNGPFTYYWENGLKEREGSFLNDTVNGTIVFYSLNGIDTNRVHYYMNGISILTKEYKNGKVKTLLDREKGEIFDFGSNGEIIKKTKIK
jgi:antitoxin component YwqK of YwqJK toxin-antitoxin module